MRSLRPQHFNLELLEKKLFVTIKLLLENFVFSLSDDLYSRIIILASTDQVTTKHSLKCLTSGPKWSITILLGGHGHHGNSFATGAITFAHQQILHTDSVFGVPSWPGWVQGFFCSFVAFDCQYKTIQCNKYYMKL